MGKMVLCYYNGGKPYRAGLLRESATLQIGTTIWIIKLSKENLECIFFN